MSEAGGQVQTRTRIHQTKKSFYRIRNWNIEPKSLHRKWDDQAKLTSDLSCGSLAENKARGATLCLISLRHLEQINTVLLFRSISRLHFWTVGLLSSVWLKAFGHINDLGSLYWTCEPVTPALPQFPGWPLQRVRRNSRWLWESH